MGKFVSDFEGENNNPTITYGPEAGKESSPPSALRAFDTVMNRLKFGGYHMGSGDGTYFVHIHVTGFKSSKVDDYAAVVQSFINNAAGTNYSADSYKITDGQLHLNFVKFRQRAAIDFVKVVRNLDFTPHIYCALEDE